LFLSWHGFSPQKKRALIAPSIQTTRDISIVIPVKNNQNGIDYFLNSFMKTQKPEHLPLEIIIVDDPESTTYLKQKHDDSLVKMKVVKCDKPGPASARNCGWRIAEGEWILFTDSDCIPTASWLEGYLVSSNGSVGYAGDVLAFGQDSISRYYDSQRILVPSSYLLGEVTYPDYLITANALIWKEALNEIGGFSESIKIAAGEDIDLGFRLREIGELSFATTSKVYHNFDDGFFGFMKRFKRYGKGNRILADLYSLNMRPRDIRPREKTLKNSILSRVQYLSLLWGYHFG
jgi:glycosyltransferase involved in cell wall biosynthesis